MDKNLKIALIIIASFVILGVSATLVGNIGKEKNEPTNVPASSEVENNIETRENVAEVENVTETMANETATERTQNIDNNYEEKNKIDMKQYVINNVIKPIRNNDGIIKIKSLGKFLLINNNGEVYKNDAIGSAGNYVTYLSNGVVSNGYLTINNLKVSYGMKSSEGKSKVFDLKGNVIKESKQYTIYGPVSKSGYLCVFERQENFEGEKYVYQIQDLQGNVIREYTKTSDGQATGTYQLITDDVFFNISEKVLFNARTGKVIDVSNYVSGSSNYFKGYNDLIYYYTPAGTRSVEVFNSDLTVHNVLPKNVSVKEIINDKYFYGSRYIEDDKIYDMQGNIVKEITTGGVKKIVEFNGDFYILSDTKYIYTLDKDFNQIAEPVKNDYGVLFVTPKGVLIRSNDGYCYIDRDLKENYEPFKELPKSATLDDTIGENDFPKLEIVQNYLYFYTRVQNSSDKSYIIYDAENGKILDLK